MTVALLIIAAVVVLFGFVVAFGAPYVPSLRKEVRSAFTELYPVSEHDVVFDLGSGDGVVLDEASKRGARCSGVELNPVLAVLSKLRLGKRANIRIGDMWHTALQPDVTLVYAFTVSRDTVRLERFMQRQATRLNKELHLMTFGPTIKGIKPVRVRKAHSLYIFKPLQAD